MAGRVSFFVFAAILCSALVRIQADETPTEQLPQASPECAALPSKDLKDMPFPVGESLWYVGKLYVAPAGAAPATPLPEGPAPAGPAPAGPAPAGPAPAGPAPAGCANTCSITSYKPDSCQGIKLLISRNEDYSICFKEATISKDATSVSLMKDMWIPTDPTKAIIKQVYGYSGTMDQSSTITITETASEEVKTSQSADFVFLGAGEGREWALFTSCCKKYIFVLYNDATVCAKTTQTFDDAIKGVLQPLNVKFEDLQNISTDFSIKLDAFIPSVVASSGTPPATPAGTPPGTPPTTPPGTPPTTPPGTPPTTPPGTPPTTPPGTPPTTPPPVY